MKSIVRISAFAFTFEASIPSFEGPIQIVPMIEHSNFNLWTISGFYCLIESSGLHTFQRKIARACPAKVRQNSIDRENIRVIFLSFSGLRYRVLFGSPRRLGFRQKRIDRKKVNQFEPSFLHFRRDCNQAKVRNRPLRRRRK